MTLGRRIPRALLLTAAGLLTAGCGAIRRPASCPPERPASFSVERLPASDTLPAISGTVLDWRGRPLEDVRVRLVRTTPPSDTVAVRGDARGSFTIQTLPPGKFAIDLLRVGARRMTRAVELAPGERITIRAGVDRAIGLIADCIGPDGRGFGSQFCAPDPPCP